MVWDGETLDVGRWWQDAPTEVYARTDPVRFPDGVEEPPGGGWPDEAYFPCDLIGWPYVEGERIEPVLPDVTSMLRQDLRATEPGAAQRWSGDPPGWHEYDHYRAWDAVERTLNVDCVAEHVVRSAVPLSVPTEWPADPEWVATVWVGPPARAARPGCEPDGCPRTPLPDGRTVVVSPALVPQDTPAVTVEDPGSGLAWTVSARRVGSDAPEGFDMSVDRLRAVALSRDWADVHAELERAWAEALLAAEAPGPPPVPPTPEPSPPSPTPPAASWPPPDVTPAPQNQVPRTP